MKRMQFGGTLGKYLLALLLIMMLVGFFWWKESYGVFGHVAHISGSTAGEIVFVRQGQDGKMNLFVVQSDGTGVQPLTNDKSYKRTPAWAPDGKDICYSGESEVGGSKTMQLFLLGSGDPQQATSGSIGKEQPQWRPDGKVIGYLSGGVIKVMNPNGTGILQVYPPPRRGGGQQSDNQDEPDVPQLLPPIRAFQWSPNNSSIAAIQVVEGESAPPMGQSDWWKQGSSNEAGAAPSQSLPPESVMLLPSIDTKPKVMPQTGGNHVSICWFPDGIRLAVAANGDSEVNTLVVHRTDDIMLPMQPILLAKSFTVAPENPSVSPDGSKIAFELWKMDSAENRELLGISVMPANPDKYILIKNMKDAARIPLLIHGNASRPLWSPDGKKMLYTLPGKGGRDIWVCNADGSNPVNLTKGQGDNIDPQWSPAH
jgi:TolB protein